MSKNIKYTTPSGTAIWPHLASPEFYEGNEVGFTIKLQLSQEETAKMKAFLTAELEKVKESPEFSGKTFSKTPNMGISEDKDGNEMFKFKSYSNYLNRNKERIERYVPLFDSNGAKLPKGTEVGHNSIVRVAYSIKPYWMHKGMNGIRLQLEGVQVIEMQSADGGSASDLGFGTVEGGYVAEENIATDVNTEGDIFTSEGNF